MSDKEIIDRLANQCESLEFQVEQKDKEISELKSIISSLCDAKKFADDTGRWHDCEYVYSEEATKRLDDAFNSLPTHATR